MPAGRRARRLLAPALLICALPAPAAASSATRRPAPSPPAAGVFSISPGDHEVVGRPGQVLSPTLVRNTTALRLAVTLVPELVTQQRDGLFSVVGTPASRRAAELAIGISRRRFTMRPHSAVSVLERWRPGASARPTYAAIVYTGSPARVTRGVRVVDRLLGIELLGLRGDGPARGRLRAVTVSDAGAHRLRVVASLRNVGATFGVPSRVEMVVRSRGGRVVARVASPPGMILPGVTRDFPALLPRMTPDAYTVTAVAQLGGGVAPISRRFRVVGGGLLPAPDFVTGPLQADGTVGGSAHVSLAVRNDGTRSGVVRGTVSLHPMRDGVASTVPVAVRSLTPRLLAPGEMRVARVSIGDLGDRSYAVEVHVNGPVRAGARGTVVLEPRPRRAESPLAWLGHLAATVGWPAVAGLLALGLGAARMRRRRGRSRRGAAVRLRPLP